MDNIALIDEFVRMINILKFEKSSENIVDLLVSSSSETGIIIKTLIIKQILYEDTKQDTEYIYSRILQLCRTLTKIKSTDFTKNMPLILFLFYTVNLIFSSKVLDIQEDHIAILLRYILLDDAECNNFLNESKKFADLKLDDKLINKSQSESDRIDNVCKFISNNKKDVLFLTFC